MTLRSLVTGLAHIGIRVHDYDVSRAFYAQLGFEHAWGPVGPDHVAAMRHACGLELNFIVNAKHAAQPNVLMDGVDKFAGITHIALAITDVAAVEAALERAGIPISGRRGSVALFVRDPDRNVIELASD
ncbi:MAG TPA: VOC family protein [Polyangiales bacterium]|nr:VOC family protein [Polyangiales bacterium]